MMLDMIVTLSLFIVSLYNMNFWVYTHNVLHVYDIWCCMITLMTTIMFISLTVGVLITTHPQDELVNVSDNVTFTCEALGSPPINYSWLYNGNYILDDPGHFEGANTDTLMIINVLVSDWGIYSCDATNIVNNATSNEATLYGECVYLCVCMRAHARFAFMHA